MRNNSIFIALLIGCLSSIPGSTAWTDSSIPAAAGNAQLEISIQPLTETPAVIPNPFLIRDITSGITYEAEEIEEQTKYQFTGLPFGDYQFELPENAVIAPLKRNNLFRRENGKSIVIVQTESLKVPCGTYPLTPVRLSLKNDWEFVQLHFNWRPFRQGDGSSLTHEMFLFPSDIHYFQIDFQRGKTREVLRWMAPGIYSCSALSIALKGQPLPEPGTVKPSYGRRETEFAIPVQPNEEFNQDIVFAPAGHIEGEINSDLFEGFTVRLHHVDTANHNFVLQSKNIGTIRGGRFVIRNAPVGTWRLQAGHSIQEPVLSEPFTLVEETTTFVKIDASRIGQKFFLCKITDSAGLPIPDYRVHLEQGHNRTEAKSNQEGDVKIAYRKNGVDSAKITISPKMGIFDPNSEDSSMQIHLKDDCGKTLRFPNLTRLSFRVIDREGKPVPQATVRIFKGKKQADALPNPNIFCGVDHPEGKYSIEAFPKGPAFAEGGRAYFPSKEEMEEIRKSGKKIEQPPADEFMTYFDVKDDKEIVFQLGDRADQTITFVDGKQNPISDVSLFQPNMQFSHDGLIMIPVDQRPCPQHFCRAISRSNPEGNIILKSSKDVPGQIYMFSHETYGLGYFQTDPGNEKGQTIVLNNPATFDLQPAFKERMQYYCFLAVKTKEKPYVFCTPLEKLKNPNILLQPGSWWCGFTETNSSYSNIYPLMTFHEKHVVEGSVIQLEQETIDRSTIHFINPYLRTK